MFYANFNTATLESKLKFLMRCHERGTNTKKNIVAQIGFMEVLLKKESEVSLELERKQRIFDKKADSA